MARATRTGGREATAAVIPGKAALSVGRPDLQEPEGFTWAALSEAARLESGHTPSRNHPEYWDGGIPWVGLRDATGNHGRLLARTEQTVSELGVENSSTRLLPKDTVCLSRTASVGYVVQLAVAMCTSQDFVNWVCGPDLNPNYLRYLLMSEQEMIRRVAYGTTHQTMYYPDAKALHVLMPGRAQQDAIAEVLGALDDKIASNSTLAGRAKDVIRADLSLARADGERKVLLGQLVEFHNRKRVPLSSRERDVRRGNVPYWGANGVLGHVDKALFNEPLVLVGEDGTVETDDGHPVVHYVWGPTWVNNHAHVLTGRGVSTELLRYLVEAGGVSPLITGAVQPKLSMGNLKRLELVLPVHGLDRVEAHCLALQKRVVACAEESRHLATLRDTLLPHLMSGRLTVRDAEARVEAAL